MNQIVSHITFANAILSLILIVELLTMFKRPLLLKGLFLSIAISMLLANISALYSIHFKFNRLLSELSRVFFILTILNLLYVIYYHKLKKSALVFSFILLGIKCLSLYYFSVVLKIDNSISLNQNHAQNFLIQIPRVMMAPIYFIFCFVIYRKIRASFHDNNIFYQKIKSWSRYVIFSFYLLALSFILQFVIPNNNLSAYVMLITSSFCFSLLLLFRPSFLNKTNLEISLSNRFDKLQITSAKPQNINLSKDFFTISFFHKSYFSNVNASLKDLSEKLEITPEELKDFIFLEYNSTFTDLVNKSRVELFVELIKNKSNNHFTIEGLSEKAGFGSRQNFHKAFKKFHGGNPSDLIRMHE